MTTTNLERFPLVVVTFPPRLDVAAADAFIEGQRAVLARRALHVNLYDASAVTSMPDAAMRRRLVEFTHESELASKRYNVASVLVVQSTVVRAGITAIHWLAPPPTPISMVPTFAEALRACARLLDERGLALPPAPEGSVASR